MVANLIRFTLFIVCLFASMLTMACGTKYNVRGQVVDASTNAPIEGASIAIVWTGQDVKQYAVPYASGDYFLEKNKTKSDKNGYFIIPNFPLAKDVEMGVYKNGYVCWDLKYIFQKGQRNIYDLKGMVKKREGFKIKNNMVIKLEPFTSEYNRPTHAKFVEALYSATQWSLEGIGEELKIYKKYYWNKKRGQK